jgi:hypothetical protein
MRGRMAFARDPLKQLRPDRAWGTWHLVVMAVQRQEHRPAAVALSSAVVRILNCIST